MPPAHTATAASASAPQSARSTSTVAAAVTPCGSTPKSAGRRGSRAASEISNDFGSEPGTLKGNCSTTGASPGWGWATTTAATRTATATIANEKRGDRPSRRRVGGITRATIAAATATPTTWITRTAGAAKVGEAESMNSSNEAATKFSKIVLMTSLAPKRAFRKPGMAPHKAPPSAAAATARGTTSQAGPGTYSPTNIVPIAPSTICPGAPMLNRPARNPKPTAKPVKISGVANDSASKNPLIVPSDPEKRV